MVKEFRNLVLQGKFDDAFVLSQSMKELEVRDELIAISFDNKNILAYGYLVHVLQRNESVLYHWLANALLGVSYIEIEGASKLAYLHIKRALEIDDTSFIALAALMGHATGPDCNATREEYDWARNRIAELYPDDPILKVPFGGHFSADEAEKSRLTKWDDA